MPLAVSSRFLPLSFESAEALARGEGTAGERLRGLSLAELAGVLLVQSLSTATGAHPDQLERQLAALLDAGQTLDRSAGPGTFAALVSERFDAGGFAHGLERLEDLHLELLSEVEVEEHDFLRPSGDWDFGFQVRHRRRLDPCQETFRSTSGRSFRLTTSQARIFGSLAGESEESLHLQALAGTGKTHMIEVLLEMLAGQRPLVLAQTGVQLQALESRMHGRRLLGMTFAELARQLLEQDLTQPQRRVGHRGRVSYQLSDEDAARMLEIGPVADLPPRRVAQICRRAVAGFCNTTAPRIDVEHLPRVDTPLSPLDLQVLVEYAERFWQETLEPSAPDIVLPIRSYHRIKQLSLMPELTLDAQFTHVIVDESHDLSAPMVQFLDRCRQPTYTLGDCCQRLDGLVSHRSARIRQREVYQSVRAGQRIEEVLNPLIEAHPRATCTPLEGNRDRSTRIRYYDRPQIPEAPTTILVHSEWGLFEWFQRLGAADARFALLPGAEIAFREFVTSCIELFHRGQAPRHPLLFRFSSWSSLAGCFAENRSFRNIDAMLRKGYEHADFERTLQKMDRSGQARIRLGRVQDARNLELDAVMLTPDLLVPVPKGDAAAASRMLSALYIGASRARFELHVPGYLRDWLQDQPLGRH